MVIVRKVTEAAPDPSVLTIAAMALLTVLAIVACIILASAIASQVMDVIRQRRSGATPPDEA